MDEQNDEKTLSELTELLNWIAVLTLGFFALLFLGLGIYELTKSFQT